MKLTPSQIIVALTALGVAAVICAWASLGYPTQAQICEPGQAGENCTSHNIIFASVW